ncbi:MAG: hypothetical protein E7014_04205 [Alphaproteobacteria bacterium]|nr:hypothetical protein [Alphaproteobacteria bacterium]
MHIQFIIASCLMKKIHLIILFFCVILTSFITYAEERIFLQEDTRQIPYIYYPKKQTLCPEDKSNFNCLNVFLHTKTSLHIQTETGKRVYIQTREHNVYQLLQDSRITSTTPKKIAILYISTGKYIQFWNNFYHSAERYFLPNHHKTYFLFTNHDTLDVPTNVIKIHQDQLPWPYITFQRYHFFSKIAHLLKEYDYIFFMNGTLFLKDYVHEEIFPTKEQGIMVTLHPGQYRKAPATYPYERHPSSQAYVSYEDGIYYVAGGFNGGTAESFLKLTETIKQMTEKDLKNNILPQWHDESMLNRYLIDYMKTGKKPLILTPQYLMPESDFFNIAEFLPYTKILILEKKRYGGAKYLRQNN